MMIDILIPIAHAADTLDDAPGVAEVLLNFLEFLLFIAGAIAVIAFVVSGIMYLFSGGNEERASTAKKSVYFSGLGIAIILGSLIIIRQLVRFYE